MPVGPQFINNLRVIRGAQWFYNESLWAAVKEIEITFYLITNGASRKNGSKRET